MSNWINTNINLGYIEENKKYEIVFESFEDLDINSVKPSCGNCTKVKYYKNKILKIIFSSGEIPKHLKNKEYYISKSITVFYKDKTTERLTFFGIIKQ